MEARDIVDVSGYSYTEDELEENIERYWEARSYATRTLVALIGVKILTHIRQYIPEAATLVLKEDTSHLPPHGHVEDILTQDGSSVMPEHEEWHDLGWAAIVDDDVWDIYYLDSLNFVTGSDGVRRMTITLNKT